MHSFPPSYASLCTAPQDMTEDEVMAICEKYTEANEKYKHEKDTATYVKKNLDEGGGGTWHVVVGRKFGCSVAHAAKKMLHFQDGAYHVLAFMSHEIDLTGTASS